MSSDKLPELFFWAVAGSAVALFQIVRLVVGREVSYNAGIAFGLKLPATAILILSILFVLAIAAWFFTHRPRTFLWAVALGLIVGGGASNLLERVWFGGSVADYIAFGKLGSFNLADIAIVVGIGLALYKLLKDEQA